MPEEIQTDYASALLSEFNTKLRDIEEKQKLLKERVLLIGQNLIESKEELKKETTEIKLSLQGTIEENKKIRGTLIRLTEELEKRARKSEIELLQKQAKMFQPLEFARIEDVKKLLKDRGK